MSAFAANRPSVVRRAAIARGFEEAIRRNTMQIAREQSTAGEIDSIAFRDFAQQAALATGGPCFRYSQRLKLLDLAQRGGINRFDANLIIAAIQHRAENIRAKSTAPKLSQRALLLSTALAVQAAIVLGAWLALSH